MDIVLIAGLWLPRTTWAGVASDLEGRGHRPLPVALPGADDGSTEAALEDQVDAVLAVVDAASRPMVVGHSAACTLAWIVADRQPEAIDRVVLIGGFPAADGERYADFFPAVDGVVPFPGWEPFEGADAADLDQDARDRFAQEAVPVPAGVTTGPVRLGDDRRFDVPVVLVCPEYGPDEAKSWIEGGDVPELTRAKHMSYVDIASGHWPMISAPGQLAAILDEATRS